MTEPSKRALDSVSAGVVHDLNNFLAAVLGATDAIAERAQLDAETRDGLEHIRDSVQAAATLARGLVAEPQDTPAADTAAAGPTLRQFAAGLRYTLPAGVRLELDLADTDTTVGIAALALRRIMTNLVNNAVKAMPAGGTLALRCRPVTAPARRSWRGAAIPRGTYVQIDVHDSGTGIPPDVLPRIFDPYFTTARGRGGHGLGLAAVDTLVREAHGHIAVTTRERSGTCISLFLPARDAAPPPRLHAPLRRDLSAPSGGIVLVVDDDATVLRHTGRALRHLGWRVLEAASAEEALQVTDAFEAPRLAAVVTDLELPGMGGAVLIAQLRARLNRPTLPAVILSGYPLTATRRQITLSGCIADSVQALAKPFEARELASLLAEATAEAR